MLRLRRAARKAAFWPNQTLPIYQVPQATLGFQAYSGAGVKCEGSLRANLSRLKNLLSVKRPSPNGNKGNRFSKHLSFASGQGRSPPVCTDRLGSVAVLQLQLTFRHRRIVQRMLKPNLRTQWVSTATVFLPRKYTVKSSGILVIEIASKEKEMTRAKRNNRP